MSTMRLTIRHLFIILLVLGLFILTLYPIVDPDFWWHLRTGQFIVQSHSVPHAQGMANNLTFQEVPIVTRYFPEASSINFGRSMIYGFSILGVLTKYWLHKTGLVHFEQFCSNEPSTKESHT
jgi:hypothetical protein